MRSKSGAVIAPKAGKNGVAQQVYLVMDRPALPPLDLVDLSTLRTAKIYAELMDQVIPLCQKSEFDQAIQVLVGALDRFGQDAPVLNFLGALYIQTNQPVQAELYLNRAGPYAQKDIRILNNRACVFLLKNDPARAFQILESGLKGTVPSAPEYYYNMALACDRLGRGRDTRLYLDMADARSELKETLLLRMSLETEQDLIAKDVQKLKEVFKKYPTSRLLHYYLALYFYFALDVDRALYYSARLVNHDPDWTYGRILFMTIVQHMAFKAFNDHIFDAIVACLSSSGGNVSYLINVWRNQFDFLPFLKKEREADDPPFVPDVAHFMDTVVTCDDKVFKFLSCGMRRLVPNDSAFELTLTQVRRFFLARMASGDMTLHPREDVFLASLAQQSFLTEYVYFCDEQERAQRSDIKARAPSGVLTRAECLILMCYESLSDLLKTHKIHPDDTDFFEPFIQEQVTDFITEEAIAAAIPSLTSVRDDVSKKVEQMYMENPYPRWESVNFSGNLDYLRLAPRRADRAQVLVAGCGTGRHALYVALGYRNAHITALDLSRRSLAYARRKTDEMGVGHIDYIHGDILELGTWDRRFDAIESAGVLHHLADPLKGLDILLGLLKPGGMMMLGLYSEIGRAVIVKARNDIATRGLAPTPDTIRAYRHAVLTDINHVARGLHGRGDFYTLSTCRDLIFHVQETRYTLEEISKILNDRGLVFQGFNMDQTMVHQFEQEHPTKGARFDLALWHDYEQKNPTTFQNMYQFWVQKPS